MKCNDCDIEMLRRDFISRTVFYCPECSNYKITELICEHNWIPILFKLSNGGTQLRKYCTKCHDRDGNSLKQSDYDLNKIQLRDNLSYNNFIQEYRNSDIDEFNTFIKKLQTKQYFEYYNTYYKYINSENWKELRKKIITRDSGVCQICGAKGTNVHHLTYTHFMNEYLFELVLLCENCHLKEYHSEDAKKMNTENEKNIPQKELTI